MKTKSITKDIFINAKPEEIYSILMDSKKHSKLTESEAEISNEKGGEFSVWEGLIHGKYLELVKDKKIVQEWRAEEDDWPKGHYSKVTFEFEPEKDGTIIHFSHTDIPESDFDDVNYGWDEYYFSPMRNMYKS